MILTEKDIKFFNSKSAMIATIATKPALKKMAMTNLRKKYIKEVNNGKFVLAFHLMVEAFMDELAKQAREKTKQVLERRESELG